MKMFTTQAELEAQGFVFKYDGDEVILSGCPKEYSGSVNIPQNVTKIGLGAFCGCENIISVYIPGNVKVIEKFAFCDCKNLKSLTISEGVEEIEYAAFSNCVKLDNVVLPKSIKNIGTMVFWYCLSLDYIYTKDKDFCRKCYFFIHDSEENYSVLPYNGIDNSGIIYQIATHHSWLRKPEDIIMEVKDDDNEFVSEEEKIEREKIKQRIKEKEQKNKDIKQVDFKNIEINGCYKSENQHTSQQDKVRTMMKKINKHQRSNNIEEQKQK